MNLSKSLIWLRCLGILPGALICSFLTIFLFQLFIGGEIDFHSSIIGIATKGVLFASAFVGIGCYVAPGYKRDVGSFLVSFVVLYALATIVITLFAHLGPTISSISECMGLILGAIGTHYESNLKEG